MPTIVHISIQMPTIYTENLQPLLQESIHLHVLVPIFLLGSTSPVGGIEAYVHLHALCLQDSTISGIYHWSGNECMTKYAMTVAMGSAFGLPVQHISADNSQPLPGDVKRPHNTQLACKKLEMLGIGQRTLFHDSITECLRPFV